MTTEEEKISKNRIVRIQESCKMEYSLYKPPYLTGIEGPPPKRNVVSSSLAGGAKTTAVSHFSLVYSGFFIIVSFERSCRSAGTILYIFRCIPANWLRTFFPALLIKNADLLIQFSRPIFRMGPMPAMRPVCWPVPATCEAAPPGPPNPMWRAPVPLAPPGDEPNAGRDWHRRRSQTSGR